MANNNLCTDAQNDRSHIKQKLVQAQRHVTCLLEVCNYLKSNTANQGHIDFIAHLAFGIDEAIGELSEIDPAPDD